MSEQPSTSEHDVAPTHQDVRADYSDLMVTICVGLGTVAIVAGIVLGLVLQND